MLGSYFDLKREIARIAAQRAAADAETRVEKRGAAYSDFDDRLQDFVRSFDRAAEKSAMPRTSSEHVGPS